MNEYLHHSLVKRQIKKSTHDVLGDKHESLIHITAQPDVHNHILRQALIHFQICVCILFRSCYNWALNLEAP